MEPVQAQILEDSSMIKKAYTLSMTYSVSDEEKNQANRALSCFEASRKLLNTASNYLNTMKTPFKDNPDIDPKDIYKERASMRKFRDIAIDNFNEFKKSAFKCVSLMQMFSSDTQSVKLMKSFISSIDDLEDNVNDFANLFKDLEAKDFQTNIVKYVEDIQSKCEDIEENIDDRIKKHIQTNILGINWIDSVGDDMKLKIEKKLPLTVELYNQRQQQLNDLEGK